MRKDGCPHSQATPEALRLSVTSRRRKMRKQSRLTALFAVVLMSVMLLVTDVFATAAPASAATRWGHMTYTAPVVAHRGTRRPYRRFRRTSRSGFRAAAAPVPVTGDVWAKLRWC